MFDTISKVATTGISQKTFESNPRIPESLELFPGLLARIASIIKLIGVLIVDVDNKKTNKMMVQFLELLVWT